MDEDHQASKLQFLATASDGGTATYYASQAGEEPKAHSGQFKFCEVPIHDGRRCFGYGSLSVDRQGFQLAAHASAVIDFQNDKEVKSILYSEIEKLLLQQFPKATRIEIFDHTRRAATADLRKELNCREPSAIVHNDYTEKSATKRLYDFFPHEAEKLSKKRWAILNVWRTTTVNVEDDLISVKRIAKDRVGELQMALHNPSQKWYYFPRLTPEEALIFKTFDSDAKCTNFTIHTALSDVGNVSIPRQSIELRAFVFF